MDRFRRGPSLRQAIVSYAPDWALMSAAWLIGYYVGNHVTGFKRQFSLTDISLHFPHVHQRVSSSLLALLSIVLPLGVQAIVSLLFMRSWWDLHHSALGLWSSISITSIITQTVKVTAGRPRPDLLSRCQPAAGSEDPMWGLSTVDICTQTSTHLLEDGWRSFPSGHSSLSFAGLGFLAFYLAGKLHLFDTRGYTAKIWLTLVPLGIASWVALTRTMDYRHHWQDVLTGSALGLGVAYFSYRQYYPSLTSKVAHIPFTTRFEEAEYIGNEPTIFRDDVDVDVDEEVGLTGRSRKPQGSDRT